MKQIALHRSRASGINQCLNGWARACLKCYPLENRRVRGVVHFARETETKAQRGRQKGEDYGVQEMEREPVHIYRVTDNTQIGQMSKDTRETRPVGDRDTVVATEREF